MQRVWVRRLTVFLVAVVILVAIAALVWGRAAGGPVHTFMPGSA